MIDRFNAYSLEHGANAIRDAIANAFPLSACRIVGLDTHAIDIALEDADGHDWLISVNRPQED